ncbi:MAG: AAA family ATPase [Rhizobiales bacterium]|nr:AAA family ATPase [Hyphomicrobiales bacterium]
MYLTDEERGLIAHYAMKVLEQRGTAQIPLRPLLGWLAERSGVIGIHQPAALMRLLSTNSSRQSQQEKLRQACEQHFAKLIGELALVAEPASRNSSLGRNIAYLAKAFRIGSEGAAVLEVLAHYTRQNSFESLADVISKSARELEPAIAILAGIPVAEVRRMLGQEGTLVGCGLVQIASGSDISGPGGKYLIPERINEKLDETFARYPELRQAMLGTAEQSRLLFADYDYMADARDLMCQLLAGAAEHREIGVNILIHGPPGTGKTELARVASRRSKMALYEAGAIAEDDDEDCVRINDLAVMLKLTSSQGRAAVLFERAEQVDWDDIVQGCKRGGIERLMGQSPVPIIWTADDISALPRQIVQRMTLVVGLLVPPASQRARILKRMARRHKVPLSPTELNDLAERLEAPAIVLENAMRTAKISSRGADAVLTAATNALEAVAISKSGPSRENPGYEPALVCMKYRNEADALAALPDRLAGASRLDFSLCLSGPPGTGKSAYARELARRLGLEVVQKRASDLLGSYVGESEKLIAGAFEEARNKGLFMIFDEADSLLLDRSGAVRSWEITQVNEMLTWMEDHAYPICFTTNLMDRIDPATLRRFTFHFELDYLDRVAIAHAFRTFFEIDKAPEAALAIGNLTPGDFALARKQAKILGSYGHPERVLELIERIARTKPGARGRFGF